MKMWYSIKYNLKCIGNAIESSMQFGGFKTASVFLFVMDFVLLQIKNVWIEFIIIN